MSAVFLFIAAKGLLVRRPTGRPPGLVFTGGRDTFGERVIRDGGRRRWSCAIERTCCHDCGSVSCDEDDLCWQNKHNVCGKRDIKRPKDLIATNDFRNILDFGCENTNGATSA